MYQSATVVPLLIELALVEGAARSIADLDERVRVLGAEWRVVEVGVMSGREVGEVQSVHVRSVPTGDVVERWEDRRARAVWRGAAGAGRGGERLGALADLVG